MKKVLCALMAAVCLTQGTTAQEKSKYIPDFHGTVRAKYEYAPRIDKGRFEVRNVIVGVEGLILPTVTYKAEIDLCNEGSVKMRDAYIRYTPIEGLRFTIGQMRPPFSIDAHHAPHQQYFANRSFIARQSARDVGMTAYWKFGKVIPVTLEGGIFNGSGLTGQKDFWTNNYNFSFKAQTMIARHVNVTLSCFKSRAGDVNTMMYDAGTYWQNSRWHIEAEYLRKYYSHDRFRAVNIVNTFGVYRIPMHTSVTGLSFLARYDYMSDNCKGGKDDNGVLIVDEPERHRVTGGVTLSLGHKALSADVRLNYEQYFYNEGIVPTGSDQNRLVIEFVAHF